MNSAGFILTSWAFNHSRYKGCPILWIESQLSWAPANKNGLCNLLNVEFTCIYHFSRFCSDILDNFGSWHSRWWIGAITTRPPDCFKAFLTTRTGLAQPIPWRRVPKRDDAPGGGEMREAMVPWKVFSWTTKKTHQMRCDTIVFFFSEGAPLVMWCWFGVFLHIPYETSHLIESFFRWISLWIGPQIDSPSHPQDCMVFEIWSNVKPQNRDTFRQADSDHPSAVSLNNLRYPLRSFLRFIPQFRGIFFLDVELIPCSEMFLGTFGDFCGVAFTLSISLGSRISSIPTVPSNEPVQFPSELSLKPLSHWNPTNKKSRVTSSFRSKHEVKFFTTPPSAPELLSYIE